ncbi:hypothetical protein K402DRAFT_399199 [Aulographum hederae CBS 113979]|uniref:Uncharacterized protein n=1 Tax=Aulographum hederae CBS 113979 TaxID=1176131 RepID=A0A6G1GJ06_9PEZI|nr:hypothetical protein K402DRAFT_399199 [Aulographum hederae CBS 113979]
MKTPRHHRQRTKHNSPARLGASDPNPRNRPSPAPLSILRNPHPSPHSPRTAHGRLQHTKTFNLNVKPTRPYPTLT